MTQNSESDKLLLDGFCAGDPECAGEFVQHFLRPLSLIAFRIVGDSGTAEDVVQVAFERAWRSGVMFDPERGSLDAWMMTIARNVALDWVRTKRAIPISSIREMVRSPRSGPVLVALVTRVLRRR